MFLCHLCRINYNASNLKQLDFVICKNVDRPDTKISHLTCSRS